MTPAEIQIVLVAAKAFDDRVSTDQARAAAWASALEADMTLDAAREALIEHYANRTDAVMPAHLNTAWRIKKRSLREQFEREERERKLKELESVATEMPPEIRAQLRAFREKRAMA